MHVIMRAYIRKYLSSYWDRVTVYPYNRHITHYKYKYECAMLKLTVSVSKVM